ncbi:hypothetical protein MPTK1_1g19240 [Marchantia polymorpha subsp. ruderalis]|uniref:Uncharacterized protein n=2 Tax=Marchantia polymorpha TaxID=3197 RepID=A0AAF6ARU1_MARPO|nr:hypothetical protein MARPO_0001s0262 [Marchantia polymorpha]BBM99161.1 hypothetical protein Mp_1g19240 [Marchantia polymorpha subsp. ruderalis]|eukprot:PTQ50238.1 hypothetical protein MARPO_0001s0262 [Marchantia polymorpha]
MQMETWTGGLNFCANENHRKRQCPVATCHIRSFPPRLVTHGESRKVSMPRSLPRYPSRRAEVLQRGSCRRLAWRISGPPPRTARDSFSDTHRCVRSVPNELLEAERRTYRNPAVEAKDSFCRRILQ